VRLADSSRATYYLLGANGISQLGSLLDEVFLTLNTSFKWGGWHAEQF
jgi:hypothetical protein